MHEAIHEGIGAIIGSGIVWALKEKITEFIWGKKEKYDYCQWESAHDIIHKKNMESINERLKAGDQKFENLVASIDRLVARMDKFYEIQIGLMAGKK